MHIKRGAETLTTKQTPLLCFSLAIWLQTFRFRLNALRLLKRNTQTFRAHARRFFILRNITLLRSRAQLFKFVLACFRQTVGDQTNVLGVQGRNEVLPFCDIFSV